VTFADYAEIRRQEVEAALARHLPTPPAVPAVVADAIRYSLMAGGKRLRPLVVLAAAEGVAQATGSSEVAARDVEAQERVLRRFDAEPHAMRDQVELTARLVQVGVVFPRSVPATAGIEECERVPEGGLVAEREALARALKLQ